MVTITVKLFSIYQEAYGQEELVWTFPEGSSVMAILERVLADHPSLSPWQKVTRFGVNLTFVDATYPLSDGDEVVLIPPVSGG